MANVSNSEDVLDSRDIIERIEELQAEMEDSCDEDDKDELDNLLALQDEAEGYAPDWTYGATLVRDSYFKTYAIEYASEVSSEVDAVKSDSWPFCHIDWDAAANSLQMDYTSVEFDGVTYWVR